MFDWIFACFLVTGSILSFKMGLKENSKDVISSSIRIRYFGVSFMFLCALIGIIFYHLKS